MSLQILTHREQWFRRKIGPTVSVAFTGTGSTNVGPLQPGRYRVFPAVATAGGIAYVRQGAAADAATTSDAPYRNINSGIAGTVSAETVVDTQLHSNGTDIWNDATEGAADNYVHVIGGTGISGTLYVTKISDLNAAT